jgi:C1A family cysteine protease
VPSKALGWVRDPQKAAGEKPDYAAEHLLSAAPIPKAASQEQHILSILDQGPYSSCVANATMQLIRARHSRIGVKKPKLGSRWWAYYLARASHGAQHVDQGTFLRACFSALGKFGFPPETDWPYEDRDAHGATMWDAMPPVLAFWKAADQRSPVAYYRITATGQDRIYGVKRAIAAGHCVAFGTLVTESFCNGDHTGFVGLPEAGDPIAGGHAMCLAKYDERGFSGPQSWGESWGDRGWFHFKPEVIAWNESTDFWIAENVPKFLEP